MNLSRAPLLLVLVLAGCSSDLSRRGAAMELRDHFLNAGPNLVEEYNFTAESILIQEILKPSETIRNVRFRVAWGGDTTGTHNIFFTRSDEGWAVTSYGPSAIELVAGIVLDYRYEIYSDLLPFLVYLSTLVRHWSVDEVKDQEDMSTRELLASRRRVLYRRDHAPPRAELEGLIDPDSLPADRVSWGVYPEDEPALVWVRDREDPDRICVRLEGYDLTLLLSEYYWVDEDVYYLQCTGDVGGYSSSMSPALAAEIIANGAIWLD